MTLKIYFTFLLLISSMGYSQQMKISELENLSEQDFSQFTNYVINKNYKLFSSKEKNASFTHINEKTGNIHLIEKDENTDRPYIKYMINSQSEYAELLKQLETNGYEYSGNENSEEGVFLSYINRAKLRVATIMIQKEFYKIYIASANSN